MREPELSPDETGSPAEGGGGTPRWVKVFAAVAVVVVLLFVVLAVFGDRGGHGPGRHSGAGDVAAHA